MDCPQIKLSIKNLHVRNLSKLLQSALFITCIILLLSFDKAVVSAQTKNSLNYSVSNMQFARESSLPLVTSETEETRTSDLPSDNCNGCGYEGDSQQEVLSANTVTKAAPQVTVTAHVGAYLLNLSGLASPFASIILRSNGVFYRSTTADENGYFEIDDISINKNFSQFCLEHIDYRNLGSSTACFTVPPAKNDITKKDIFLPPTIALQRSEITAGGNAVVFGYTMPHAKVTIHLQNGKTYEVTADEHGYYEVTLKNLAAGKYELFATAVYNGRPSENPTTTVKLTALSWWQQILEWIKDFFNWLWSILTGLGLGPLWFILLLIPLIIFLIVKIWPEQFTFIYDSQIYVFFHPRKKLHHAWFVGY